MKLVNVARRAKMSYHEPLETFTINAAGRSYVIEKGLVPAA